jgi:hypothetical protein
VRITAISNVSVDSSFFTYNSAFKYRWTNRYVQSVVKDLSPGTNTFNIAGSTVQITLPAENVGVRGIIIADPCFSAAYVECTYGLKYDTFTKTTALLNSFMRDADMSFYGILGDNFYDRDGSITQRWFNALEPTTKSKLLITVPGNHDFWVGGSPSGVAADQFGNGFMQYYGQDTIASEGPSGFLDFSVDPDAAASRGSLPNLRNFFFYHKIGNVAFIGFSGAHPFSATKPLFQEACAWLGGQNPKPAMALLLGHWNVENGGCESEMAVPEAYRLIQAFPGCDSMGSRLKYLMGHVHCNEVIIMTIFTFVIIITVVITIAF